MEAWNEGCGTTRLSLGSGLRRPKGVMAVAVTPSFP